MNAMAIIGKNPPSFSPAWRNSACFLRRAFCRYACPQWLCNALNSGLAPQEYAGSEYHFRTPSPGGQQSSLDDLLSANFFALGRSCAALNRHKKSAYRRNRAQRNPIQSDCLTGRFTLPTLMASSKGIGRCVSGPFSSPLRHQWVWRRAVTPSANKLLSGAPWARVLRLLQAVALPQALRSVPLATLSTAKPTPTAVTNTPRATRFESNNTLHRSALRQGGVLRFQDKTREAPCSKSS